MLRWTPFAPILETAAASYTRRDLEMFATYGYV
jgi:hypothetical protein